MMLGVVAKRRWMRRLTVAAVVLLMFDALWLSFIAVLPEDIGVNKDTPLKFVSSFHMDGSQVADKARIQTVYGQCAKPTILDMSGHSDIYTYDLPAITDYSLAEKDEYKVPVRSIEEAAYGPNMEEVEVIIVPFSHADPGYGNTMEGYYSNSVKHTLNSMLTSLNRYQNLTFQWAETVFLERWWRDLQEDKRNQVKELIRRGQFEIVLGGWVMPDEASTHYASVIDQLIEGHQWLVENLNVIPRNSWSNDPFGYSSTMPYLWKQTGMDNMLILRIHQAIKGTLMKKKSLEFQWQQYWSNAERNSILCTLMPYRGYWIGDVCGPNRQPICREYAFHRTHPIHKVVFVTDQNVAERSRILYEQYRVTADLFQFKTLYMGLGEDFNYNTPDEFERIHNQFDKIMRYVNAKKEWKMKIRFGTVDDYFKTIRKQQEHMKKAGGIEVPTLSGDFFPYSDFQNDYWTGYYTTRPANKRTSRELQSLIRGADILNTYAYAYCKQWGVAYASMDKVSALLREARRDLGMFLHHDGITGTSVSHVVADFENRLFSSHGKAREAYRLAISTLLSYGEHSGNQIFTDETVLSGKKDISNKVVFKISDKGTSVVVMNPTERTRKECVSIHLTDKHVRVVDNNGNEIPAQIDTIAASDYRFTFEVEHLPFQIRTYDLEPRPMTDGNSMVSNTDNSFVLQNDYLKAEFHHDTGMLMKVTWAGKEPISVDTTFMAYTAKRSGAYIFAPTGPAQMIFDTEKPTISQTSGKKFSEIIVQYKGFMQTTRLFHVTGPQGQGLHVQNKVDIKQRGLNEREVILRFKTDIKNGDVFFTDQNGFQLMGRKTFRDRLIESNFYPLTTMAILEDEEKRLTLHSRQPHGVASLQEGWLEVMLDRNMLRDDRKGLGQGVTDNRLTVSEFVLQLEYKDTPQEITEPRFTYPSESSAIINELFQNPLYMLYATLKDSSLHLKKSFIPIQKELPCDIYLTGLRNLVKSDLTYNGTSLVVHRKLLHCGYPSNGNCRVGDKAASLSSIFPGLTISQASETSLSHLHVKRRVSAVDAIVPGGNELRTFKIDF